MRSFLVAILLAGWFSLAKAQNKIIVLAPLIGLDQLGPKRTPIVSMGTAQNVAVVYKTGILYGVEGSYVIKRMLLSGQVTTTNRTYEATGDYNGQATLPIRVNVQARYFSLPLTVSYLLKARGPLQYYAGVGILPELISGPFESTSYDILGSGRSIRLAPQTPSKPFSVGALIHIRARYGLSERIVVQLQGEFRYFNRIENPFITTDNTSSSVSASVGYRLY